MPPMIWRVYTRAMAEQAHDGRRKGAPSFPMPKTWLAMAQREL